MSRLKRQFSDFYQAISSDVFAFCRAMNFEPTTQQAGLLTAVQEAQRHRSSNWIACKSGQGPGKTASSVIIGLWRALQAPYALTIVTAPTMRQCRDVWLVEARRRIAVADPFLQRIIEVMKTKITICNQPDWGVKLVTATREENAQGYHEENMTVIAEEASGIPRELIVQFKGTLSNPNALFLQIGNPNTRDCSFFDCFNSQRHRWNCITFNAEETARDYPHIVSPQRNKDLEEEFGRDSDVYRIRVLGEFPHADPNCVMSSEDVEQCMDQSRILEAAVLTREGEVGNAVAKQFGVDFARFGGDESVIYRRHGNAIVEWERHSHVDPSVVVDRVFRMQQAAGWRDDETWYVVDAGGMGQGIVHRFYEAEKQVLEFHFGGKASDPQFENRVTEAYFHVAHLAKLRHCCLPKDNLLLQQLTTRQYMTTRKGKLVLESKDDFMKRGFESPDRADACVMAFYDSIWTRGHLTRKPDADHQVGVHRKARLTGVR